VRTYLLILFFCLSAVPVSASVELALGTRAPSTVQEVYYRDGVSFLAIDDVLPVFGLKGHWDSVDHVYDIATPFGTGVISPGSQYLRIGERFIPLKHMPRFIDGRLRVDEDFVSEELPGLLGVSVYYRNLNPPAPTPAEDETSLGRFFSFLLQKKEADSGPSLRGVVLDPGHGGQDTGSLGLDSSKEKAVDLEVAKGLEKQIKMQLGIPVYLTRDNDYALTAEQRVEPAARPDVDVLLQLHAEASFSPDTSGIFLFVRPQEEFKGGAVPADQGASMALAKSLKAALEEQGLTVRKIVPAPLLPLGRGNLPTVLVEMGFLTNAGDVALLTKAEERNRLVMGLYNGLKTFADEQKEFIQ